MTEPSHAEIMKILHRFILMHTPDGAFPCVFVLSKVAMDYTSYIDSRVMQVQRLQADGTYTTNWVHSPNQLWTWNPYMSWHCMDSGVLCSTLVPFANQQVQPTCWMIWRWLHTICDACLTCKHRLSMVHLPVHVHIHARAHTHIMHADTHTYVYPHLYLCIHSFVCGSLPYLDLHLVTCLLDDHESALSEDTYTLIMKEYL